MTNELAAYSCGSSRGFAPRSLDRRAALTASPLGAQTKPPFIEKRERLAVRRDVPV
jgi:hypothetical protein